MKIVAIGSNLALPGIGGPTEVCEASLERLEMVGVAVAARSSWYRSAPMPASDQPYFTNGILSVSWEAGPQALMAKLHEIEAEFGRVRSVRNGPRTLDLDLIDYDGMIREGPGSPVLPHPRMRGRAFVLIPLSELVPEWRHPVDGASLGSLRAELPHGQECVRTEPRIGGKGL